MAQAGIGQALDQLDLDFGRDDLLLVLQPVAQADFDDLTLAGGGRGSIKLAARSANLFGQLVKLDTYAHFGALVTSSNTSCCPSRFTENQTGDIRR